MKWKIAVCVALAVLLQTVLREQWEPLKFIELPLAVVAYFALRRDAVQAMFIGAATGLATDLLSRGLAGAHGFTYTLVAYCIAALAARVMLDNPLVRIPVLAGATALHVAVYVLLHRMLGQTLGSSFAEFMAYTLIATTVVGTFIFLLLDVFFSERASQRRHFAFRRRAARRSLVRRL
ncbi:MAG: rod shape-determining protein MreD [Pyrinomonadaceae bacterium]|nr:rod shape-determining protein MreD [Acidobacteriota bacterium]